MSRRVSPQTSVCWLSEFGGGWVRVTRIWVGGWVNVFRSLWCIIRVSRGYGQWVGLGRNVWVGSLGVGNRSGRKRDVLRLDLDVQIDLRVNVKRQRS